MPTLNKIRDEVRRLIKEKNFPLNTERALWRGMIEFGEASDIYLKTACKGYWNKKTHKPVSEEEITRGAALNGDVVLAVDAYIEELVDVVHFIVNATHEPAPNVDLDKAFNKKLAYNFTRPKQYGISDQIKAEVNLTVMPDAESVHELGAPNFPVRWRQGETIAQAKRLEEKTKVPVFRQPLRQKAWFTTGD